MKKLRTILVDDEPLAREALKDLLADFPEVEIIAECENGFEAVKVIQTEKPDLVFLDIQMPKLDGFDVLELLDENRPEIIFVTAFDEFAIKAFEVQAVDYILKPAQKDRLAKALAKVAERKSSDEVKQLENLTRSHSDSAAPLRRLLVRDGSEVHIIPVEKIMYIEAQDDYVGIYTEGLGSHMKHERLSRLEELLETDMFCRIHRSYIININYISRIEPHGKDSKKAILKNGRNLPISKSGYSKLMRYL